MRLYIKHPDANKDYSIDWSDFLASGETIEDSEWEVDAGVTSSDPAFTDTAAVIWIASGTLGKTYLAANTVQTSGGRTEVRTIKIKIEPT
jgi:hypothetical protein